TEAGHGDFGVLSVECENRSFPSVGQAHPPAIRLERAIRDIWGLEPEGLPDVRPWLDHGKWRSPRRPDAASTVSSAPTAYAFPRADGESLHQIAVGPVHAG